MLKKSQRIPLWLPYTNTITVKKDELWFDYKGGELKIPYRRIHSIMFYGGVCPLEEKFLDVCVRKKIPVCIHRRNVSKAVWVVGSFTTSTDDILTKQIIFRGNKRKSVHISRKLLIAKFKSMFWCYGNDLMPSLTKLKRAQSIDELRIIEAIHARKYWDRYYRGLGFSHSQRRVRGDELGDILNAVSKLISGVMLRWVIYHNLSPYHGFLHVPVDYPSLIYDLMEPYRGYIEQEVWQTYNEIHETHKSKTDLTAIVIKRVEWFLDKKVYTHQTRQIVTFQELLHGNVLALRAYLLGDAKRFIVPIPGKPIGGRPLKVGYRLYGRSAGPTNFLTEAEKVSKDWELKIYPKKEKKEKDE